ncbi:hypothetical protein DW095_09475 [Bacteroides sp. AM07-16]|nr:hypothetical protein DW095_09475 [Bacteroides sp. AM07-16]
MPVTACEFKSHPAYFGLAKIKLEILFENLASQLKVVILVDVNLFFAIIDFALYYFAKIVKLPLHNLR